ncbi:MAG: DEAD-box ATP-dependent RNA helicase CshA [Isosphaeraceae bacterium]|jgi:ATP-dependent RNA helicase DeaD|nr:MAG: DEAD-box ATP-dependent RNA helicase CshA [Isosphaeraceae bacterium]
MPKKTTNGPESTFAGLGLDPRLVEALSALGYEEPTPIQREAIPPLLAGRDLIGQAATGTGKTAAFTLPLLHRIDRLGPDRPRPSALILVPTRELATQVAEAVHRYGRRLGTSVVPIYGGQSYGPQLRTLGRGVDVVVATPGRALDHIRRKTLNLADLATIVLDEADEMLDMGFAEDIDAILSETPSQRQTLLFSATLPPRIAAIARKHLRDPIKIKIGGEHLPAAAPPRVRQRAYIVSRTHKLAALGRVLDVEAPASVIVFCRRRTEVDELTEALASRGYRAEALHGGMTQDQRARVMKKFRSGGVDLLVATDVAARGLDIEHLSHVVNFDVPAEVESYVHRIGRVGRAGREGVAITLAEPREHRQLREIERATRQKIEVAQIPTVADLQARRLELTTADLREILLAGGLDPFRVVVESLAEEYDPVEIALAAVKLAHDYTVGDGDDQEIPDTTPPPERQKSASHRPGGSSPRHGSDPQPKAPRPRPGSTTQILIAAGRLAGIRPHDLVGAITNEAGIDGRQIGSIEIADRYALVELDASVADQAIAALRRSRLKGKKVSVRAAPDHRR